MRNDQADCLQGSPSLAALTIHWDPEARRHFGEVQVPLDAGVRKRSVTRLVWQFSRWGVDKAMAKGKGNAETLLGRVHPGPDVDGGFG